MVSMSKNKIHQTLGPLFPVHDGGGKRRGDIHQGEVRIHDSDLRAQPTFYGGKGRSGNEQIGDTPSQRSQVSKSGGVIKKIGGNPFPFRAFSREPPSAQYSDESMCTIQYTCKLKGLMVPVSIQI